MDESAIQIKCPRCEKHTFATIAAGPGQIVNCSTCGDRILEYELVNGYIYVLSNSAMPGLLKIGFTTRSVEERVAELNSGTGVPAPFEVEAIFPSSQPWQHELQVHQELATYRMEGKEFFNIALGQAVQQVAHICGSPSYLRDYTEQVMISRVPDIVQERQSTVRMTTRFVELDRVMGGGIVPGTSAMLIGSHGAGKSTLLLAMAGYMSPFSTIYYISAEGFSQPVKDRADQLRIAGNGVVVVGNASCDDIVQLMYRKPTPTLVIVDSIQEISEYDVGNMRRNAKQFHAASHKTNVPVIVVFHDSKGRIAADPSSVKHIFDATFYLKKAPKKAIAKLPNEDSRNFAESMRFVTSDKNRNGDTGEVGFVFMCADGFHELAPQYRQDWLAWWKANGE